MTVKQTKKLAAPVQDDALATSAINMGVLVASTPTQAIQQASGVATALADIIDKQKLFKVIRGKKFVFCEGWTTLAAMLGLMPREIEANRMSDGSWEARVDLVRVATGDVVGGASAMCGVDESEWAKSNEYARRSMAATRATSKACRLSMSWIMKLAGYEVTPAEEVPKDGFTDNKAPPIEGEATPVVDTPPPTTPLAGRAELWAAVQRAATEAEMALPAKEDMPAFIEYLRQAVGVEDVNNYTGIIEGLKRVSIALIIDSFRESNNKAG